MLWICREDAHSHGKSKGGIQAQRETYCGWKETLNGEIPQTIHILPCWPKDLWSLPLPWFFSYGLIEELANQDLRVSATRRWKVWLHRYCNAHSQWWENIGAAVSHVECSAFHICVLGQWFPTLDNPGVLGLQLPETTASTAGSEVFWGLQSNNTWVTQV